MKINRRNFLAMLGSVGTGLAFSGTEAKAWQSKARPNACGCLVDLTRCTGCRKCEEVCNEVNKLPEPERSFEDKTIFDKKRRPSATAFTAVNRYYPGQKNEQGELIPTFVKLQCMHCQDPACVSACVTGALSKADNGAVVYDPGKCIGCRYCMVACPFEIPAYEYDKALLPRVMKCDLCFDRISKPGGLPACASVCPVEAIIFGKRKDLLKQAKMRITNDPGRYVRHIYGQKEAGGTNWMYISGVEFSKLDFARVPQKPIPRLTEKIQSSLFKYLWSPIVLFGMLGGIMYMNREKNKDSSKNGNPTKGRQA